MPTKTTKRQTAATDTAKGAKKPAATATSPVLSRNGRQTRIEKSELIRERLFSAAADVVGEVGYADASIALITQKAGVAQGTFYNYFESRQDLLDQLLPSLGDHMLASIRKSAAGGADFADMEERGFRAFFAFLHEAPPFFRILNEAESFAPEGYRRHFDTVSKGYVKFLKRSLREGKFPAYEERELEAIAFILMAARNYLALRYMGHDGQKSDIPKWVVQTYMKFVLYGLQGVPGKGKNSKAPSTRNLST
jgi:AcrR family transcriptional regulator